MEELQPLPLPEAEEVRYPEPDWHKRFFNVFDWYRKQSHYVRACAIQQWEQDKTAHLVEGQGDPLNRCELWYSEQGNFFIRLHVKGGLIQENMIYFQSESCLKMYGAEVIGKVKALKQNNKQ